VSATALLLVGAPVLLQPELSVSTSSCAVDNLCQFLPQELIGKFSNLSPEELLQQTEKCVGDGTLHTRHRELCDDQVKLDKLTAVRVRARLCARRHVTASSRMRCNCRR
jgi:hypothetical protein